MQLVARSIGDSAHLGFLGAALCSLGAFLLALTLDESLDPSKVKKATAFTGTLPEMRPPIVHGDKVHQLQPWRA